MRKSRFPLVIIATVCVCVGAIAGIPTASGASAPTVSTAPATDVTNTSATLHGSVNPNGIQTSYALQWGPTTSYGHETPITSAGAGTAAQSASAPVSSLSAGTTYHFRMIAMSSAGTSAGNDESFTTTGTAPAPTPAPTAVTGTTGQVSDTAVRVNGEVDPHGQSTTFYFEYGTTASYGLQTAPVSAGAGTGNVAVHALLSGLTPRGTYHYRLVATSAGGTALGTDQSVTVGPAQSHVSFMGHMGFVSPGAVIGVEAGCFGGDTTCSGHVVMSVADTHAVIGQRDFSIGARSGGFQNIKISPLGSQLLKHNGVWRLLQIDVVVTTSTGQRTSERMSLARWVWH